ncbi:MAG: hypothetical protein P8Y92_16895, partial [Halioglobus sp.]
MKSYRSRPPSVLFTLFHDNCKVSYRFHPAQRRWRPQTAITISQEAAMTVAMNDLSGIRTATREFLDSQQ